jgi:hypothetical protein
MVLNTKADLISRVANGGFIFCPLPCQFFLPSQKKKKCIWKNARPIENLLSRKGRGRKEPKRAKEKQERSRSKRGRRGQAAPFIVGQAYLALAR